MPIRPYSSMIWHDVYADLIAHYEDLLAAWPELADGVCVTYVEGLRPDQVIRAFGGDPSLARPMRIDDAMQAALASSDAAQVVLAAQAGEWVVVMEPVSGYRGDVQAVLQAVSQVQAVSVFWSLAGVASLNLAAGGRQTFWLNLNARTDQIGAASPRVMELVEALGLRGSDSYAPALALAELLTGVRLDDTFLLGEFLGLLLAPLPD